MRVIDFFVFTDIHLCLAWAACGECALSILHISSLYPTVSSKGKSPEDGMEHTHNHQLP
uniref:Uncharacterized protein n=1 Tax=Arion vulgaris TaxID=1028688 RepID=A0A0B7B2R2_9EUPU